MNRREFLKASILAGVGLSLPVHMNYPIGTLWAEETADLAVARGMFPEAITKAAIDTLGGIGKFVSRGDFVVIKPNIGWDRPPELAANTNPEVVGTLVRLCLEAGAKRVKVFDRTVSDPRRCYKQSGIDYAARLAGAEVSYVDDRKFKDVKLHGIALKEWPLYVDILEADKVINVPIAKTHGLSILTLGMKNWMGIMGGRRGRIHQRIDESLVDVAMKIKPALIVLDAVRVLTGNGPQGGRPEDVRTMNMVIAGTDQVAVDAFGATLFGLEGRDLGYVRIGDRAGLGTMDLSKVKIKRIEL